MTLPFLPTPFYDTVIVPIFQEIENRLGANRVRYGPNPTRHHPPCLNPFLWVVNPNGSTYQAIAFTLIGGSDTIDVLVANHFDDSQNLNQALRYKETVSFASFDAQALIGKHLKI